MRQTLGLLKFVILFSSLLALTSHAENSHKASDVREAQVWLKKIQTSAKQLDYSGTFVYQQGNQVRTSRISHVRHGSNEHEKLEILDGQPREYIRNNEEIACYIPESKAIRIEKRVSRDTFPAILDAQPEELLQHYDLQKGERGRVAGHNCQTIVLKPKDKLRYGYKLWVEQSTGLLLKAQTVN